MQVRCIIFLYHVENVTQKYQASITTDMQSDFPTSSSNKDDTGARRNIDQSALIVISHLMCTSSHSDDTLFVDWYHYLDVVVSKMVNTMIIDNQLSFGLFHELETTIDVSFDRVSVFVTLSEDLSDRSSC